MTFHAESIDKDAKTRPYDTDSKKGLTQQRAAFRSKRTVNLVY